MKAVTKTAARLLVIKENCAFLFSGDRYLKYIPVQELKRLNYLSGSRITAYDK